MCKDCVRLHEELHNQSEEMYFLRKQITNLEACIRDERRDKRKLVKEKKAGMVQDHKKTNRYLRHTERELEWTALKAL